jgi:hypothetical protein
LWNRRANDVSPNRVIFVTIKNSSGVIVISIGNLFFLDRAVKTNKKGFIILWATICHVGAYLCIPLIGYYGWEILKHPLYRFVSNHTRFKD